MEQFRNNLYIFFNLTSLFYLSPVGWRSSGFYLAGHTEWTTFRERFIILVILLKLFSSLTKPNMFSQTTQVIWRLPANMMEESFKAVSSKGYTVNYGSNVSGWGTLLPVGRTWKSTILEFWNELHFQVVTQSYILLKRITKIFFIKYLI